MTFMWRIFYPCAKQMSNLTKKPLYCICTISKCATHCNFRTSCKILHRYYTEYCKLHIILYCSAKYFSWPVIPHQTLLVHLHTQQMQLSSIAQLVHNQITQFYITLLFRCILTFITFKSTAPFIRSYLCCKDYYNIYNAQDCNYL